MVTIKVFGSVPPCAKCKEVEKRSNKVAQKYEGQVEVQRFDATSDEGLKYSVFFTPTVIINEKVMAAGEVVSENEIETAVKKELGQ
jgi:hypothetical protein